MFNFKKKMANKWNYFVLRVILHYFNIFSNFQIFFNYLEFKFVKNGILIFQGHFLREKNNEKVKFLIRIDFEMFEDIFWLVFLELICRKRLIFYEKLSDINVNGYFCFLFLFFFIIFFS